MELRETCIQPRAVKAGHITKAMETLALIHERATCPRGHALTGEANVAAIRYERTVQFGVSGPTHQFSAPVHCPKCDVEYTFVMSAPVDS